MVFRVSLPLLEKCWKVQTEAPSCRWRSPSCEDADSQALLAKAKVLSLSGDSSLGGGAFMNKMIRESVLDQSISIWLKLDIKTIRKRIEKNKKRPLVIQNTQVGIEKMLDTRSIYYSMSKIHISCDGKDIKDCTTEIINKITEVKLNEKN